MRPTPRRGAIREGLRVLERSIGGPSTAPGGKVAGTAAKGLRRRHVDVSFTMALRKAPEAELQRAGLRLRRRLRLAGLPKVRDPAGPDLALGASATACDHGCAGPEGRKRPPLALTSPERDTAAAGVGSPPGASGAAPGGESGRATPS